MRTRKMIYLSLGWASLALGIIGIFVPLLPTVPFILLTSYCFSKGSDRCHQWLLRHQSFGPVILDWENRGVIRRPAKIKATIAIVIAFGASIFILRSQWPLVAMLLLLAANVMVFIWSRPEN